MGNCVGVIDELRPQVARHFHMSLACIADDLAENAKSHRCLGLFNKSAIDQLDIEVGRYHGLALEQRLDERSKLRLFIRLAHPLTDKAWAGQPPSPEIRCPDLRQAVRAVNRGESAFGRMAQE